MGKREGKQSGKGLKPGLNMADTGSVVNTVKGTVSYGHLRVSGNDPKRNQMVSGNTGLKAKQAYPRASRGR